MTKNGNEQDVVTTTEPGYPRYRVEPGEGVSLAAIDPDQTEHYRKKRRCQRAGEAA